MVTKTTEDRLDVLKKKYLALIDTKQAEIKTIQQKLSLLEELKAEADDGLGLFSVSTVVPKNEALVDRPFATTGLTESVLKSVSWFGTKPFSPPDVRNVLTKNGFKPGGKNFSVSVGTTLKRLVKQGKILTENIGGKTVYRAKP